VRHSPKSSSGSIAQDGNLADEMLGLILGRIGAQTPSNVFAARNVNHGRRQKSPHISRLKEQGSLKLAAALPANNQHRCRLCAARKLTEEAARLKFLTLRPLPALGATSM
jgi:hypothetical protein